MRPETSPNSSLGTRPSEKSERGSGRQAGQKCTMHPECRRTSDWFMIACLHAFIGNTNHKLQVQLKEAKISGIAGRSRWSTAQPLLGQQTARSGYKLIITNSIHSARYTSTPAYLPDPLSDFPRVWFRDYPNSNWLDHVKLIHGSQTNIVLNNLYRSWYYTVRTFFPFSLHGSGRVFTCYSTEARFIWNNFLTVLYLHLWFPAAGLLSSTHTQCYQNSPSHRLSNITKAFNRFYLQHSVGRFTLSRVTLN